jgi:energy-coupling factor transporter ATP-binding protein EcfA2
VEIPLGRLVCVTGVSGSGKSTLVNELLHPALEHSLGMKVPFPAGLEELRGIKAIDKVIVIDQSPIGRTPRSNPATYTGAFDRDPPGVRRHGGGQGPRLPGGSVQLQRQGGALRGLQRPGGERDRDELPARRLCAV